MFRHCSVHGSDCTRSTTLFVCGKISSRLRVIVNVSVEHFSVLTEASARPVYKHRRYINSSPQEPGCLVSSVSGQNLGEVKQRREPGAMLEIDGDVEMVVVGGGTVVLEWSPDEDMTFDIT